MEPDWSRAEDSVQRRAWDQVLRPVADELARRGAGDVGRGDAGDRRAASRPGATPESFEANRASTEASILGFAQVLEQGADPAATSLGAATLAYTQEGVRRGIELTTLIRSYRLGHAAAWRGSRR